MNEAVQKLLSELGIDAEPHGNKALLWSTASGDSFGPEAVVHLKRRLRENPDGIMLAAPSWFGKELDVEGALKLLDDAERALQTPEQTLTALKVNRSGSGRVLTPEELDFPGCHHAEIPIDPGIRKYEEIADAAAWAVTAAQAWWFRLRNEKPAFRGHTEENPFIHELRDDGATAVVALFSDWGTGYYHSQYIAKHIGNSDAHQAIHLGDVYYTGTQRQFEANFTPILERYILQKIPFFAMNANHEMDSHGRGYYAFLDRLRTYSGPNGRPLHPQRGSYFCLRNERYQVIGLDTSFFGNGRVGNDLAPMKAWLIDRLTEGRDAGRVNILLTQNEPYCDEATVLLSDLVSARDMVDLWFWGDEHYAALYPPRTEKGAPFWGSCIGHGGFPYARKEDGDFEDHYIRPVWQETGGRFDPLPLRRDRGSNGFCMLRLRSDRIELDYRDWMNNPRHLQHIQVAGGRLV